MKKEIILIVVVDADTNAVKSISAIKGQGYMIEEPQKPAQEPQKPVSDKEAEDIIASFQQALSDFPEAEEVEYNDNN